MNNNTSTVTTAARELVAKAAEEAASAFEQVEKTARFNQEKVLEAFWAERVSEADLHGSTGYGLSDEGRDKLERVYARVFGAEAALVRPQIVSGTHALKLGLFGVLRPGDHVLFATGAPYDTLEEVVGIRPSPGSLAAFQVSHSMVPLTAAGEIDVDQVVHAILPNTKMVFFQRSRGYADRPALPLAQLAAAWQSIRQARNDVVIAVDNCYGEFVEQREPCDLGADLAMGSLIKNPGGGIAPTGGYVVGRADLIEEAAACLTAPGIGAEVGPTQGFLRLFYQGLFLAPHVVVQALKGSILAARVFEKLGFSVLPKWNEARADLILTVRFNDRERLLAFCEAVQASAPVDAFVRPYGAPMAGYASDVVMAAGAFIQGGSLEMSADAPLREPYIGYFQGGLTYEHVYIALERIATVFLDM
ncbi:methionine gamma-lyase family protein [Alicyclobacillus cycloheptanicus]|jgi:cystathionine beta-lyase family protein involved in aluminum resistance|uniref:Cystathionine beta-lyase family protein involved in aluminum resistance n=1 Tax=Alicyclobacillus cycloheptanicus TaxID=1457 RepID=A0ABT9XG97_9BACL|nr:methionine gamma-lyase family protein [Alicyclobacillus cycloheptanicus]MDQ0189321.1 cystathionine beta-lyase family protein involved in aluminum resistance [Alicyclobacillus cycloheptanicus]WDM01319.1 methionine gamma-lyase family protein [Alicyclobacillus cycloheptanicus]